MISLSAIRKEMEVTVPSCRLTSVLWGCQFAEYIIAAPLDLSVVVSESPTMKYLSFILELFIQLSNSLSDFACVSLLVH